MHQAVFGCLVALRQAHYSVYLSYRTASEAPLASLIFDELNHRSQFGVNFTVVASLYSKSLGLVRFLQSLFLHEPRNYHL